MKPSIFRYEGHNYLVPFLIISSLFFMWGFAHGILEVLNPHFQESFHISKTMSALTQAAVYGAYFLMALYNPQNEMLPFHKTKCSETQNEASSL